MSAMHDLPSKYSNRVSKDGSSPAYQTQPSLPAASFPPLLRLLRFTLLPFLSSHTNLTEMLRETRRTCLTMLNFSLVQATDQSTGVRYGGEEVLRPGGREEECETVEGFGGGRRWRSGGAVEENKGNTVIGGSRMQTSTGHPKL